MSVLVCVHNCTLSCMHVRMCIPLTMLPWYWAPSQQTKVGHCEQEKEQLGKEKAELLQHKQQLELEATQKIKEMVNAYIHT